MTNSIRQITLGDSESCCHIINTAILAMDGLNEAAGYQPLEFYTLKIGQARLIFSFLLIFQNQIGG